MSEQLLQSRPPRVSAFPRVVNPVAVNNGRDVRSEAVPNLPQRCLHSVRGTFRPRLELYSPNQTNQAGLRTLPKGMRESLRLSMAAPQNAVATALYVQDAYCLPSPLHRR